ncbi:hypothetical protein [Bauldia sp.]|uniref:hypothetical protein n=1 Tax=Bauldia sp. TaxID=2575872 RepID=UPI003BAD7CC5
METPVACHVIRCSMRSARELQDLLPLTKTHCDPTEYEACAKAIASVVAEIGLGL